MQTCHDDFQPKCAFSSCDLSKVLGIFTTCWRFPRRGSRGEGIYHSRVCSFEASVCDFLSLSDVLQQWLADLKLLLLTASVASQLRRVEQNTLSSVLLLEKQTVVAAITVS